MERRDELQAVLTWVGIWVATKTEPGVLPKFVRGSIPTFNNSHDTLQPSLPVFVDSRPPLPGGDAGVRGVGCAPRRHQPTSGRGSASLGNGEGVFPRALMLSYMRLITDPINWNAL